jgi:hypothetical protein
MDIREEKIIEDRIAGRRIWGPWPWKGKRWPRRQESSAIE